MEKISFLEKVNSYFNSSDSKIIDGLSYSSDSLFIFAKNAGKSLIVAENNDHANRLYEELMFLNKNKKNSDEIILIPGTEEMPYDMVNSDKYLSSKKNLGLLQYIRSKRKKIKVITTNKNLQKKLIPHEVLNNETLSIKKYESLDIEYLKNHHKVF